MYLLSTYDCFPGSMVPPFSSEPDSNSPYHQSVCRSHCCLPSPLHLNLCMIQFHNSSIGITKPPHIEIHPWKKFIGKRMTMSFTRNKTYDPWHIMPGREQIQNAIGTVLYSIEVYPPTFFTPFKPEETFEKWAAVEVTNFDSVPDDMETIESPAGLYAVFIYNGPASEGPQTYRYIFTEWLTESPFELDTRPHFAVMEKSTNKTILHQKKNSGFQSNPMPSRKNATPDREHFNGQIEKLEI